MSMNESGDSDRVATEACQEDRIPTIEPEKEPELVGVHSGLDNDRCQTWYGETTDEISQCEDDATHTIVYYDGDLHEQAVCDEHGPPDDLPRTEREWSA